MKEWLPEDSDQYLIVLVCDNIPNQKFWNGSDWILDLNLAKLYDSYGQAGNVIWFQIPEEKVLNRITSVPLRVYEKLLKEKQDLIGC